MFAFDATTNLPKTGDAGNITAYVDKDDAGVNVLADTTATEKDATNAKGYYIFDLAQAETNGDKLLFSAKSSTANIVVIAVPAVVYTTPASFTSFTTPPTTAQIATGVWTDTTAGDFTVANSIGKSIMNGVSLGTGLTVAVCSSVTALGAGAVASIWDALLSGITTASSIGKLIKDNINAAISSRAVAGDAMTLTSGERTAIANEVEAQIIDETDSEKVLTAITDKIAAVNPSLSGLTLAAIAAAVRDVLNTSPAANSLGAAINTAAASAASAATSASSAASSASTAATQATNANTRVQLALPNAAPAGLNGLPTVDDQNNLLGGINGSVAGDVAGKVLGGGGSSLGGPGVWAVKGASEDALADAAAVATVNSKLGAYSGTGNNTILGNFIAIASKDVLIPSDWVGLTYDPATDSLEANAADNFLNYAVDEAETGATIAACLNAARAQGFGKWAIVGTTLNLYASNGTTIVKSFTLDSDTTPTSRS